MSLIDTHQHLILRGSLGYAWTADSPAIATGVFDRDVYAQDSCETDIIATIFMESGVDDADYQKEARLVSQMVGTGTIPMLGQIASCRPEINDGFDAWLEECRDLNVVGFRRILQTMPDDLSRSEMYRRNVRKIGAAGWPVDLCFAARQLPIASELIQACMDTIFVLDHCGTPDIAGRDFAVWRGDMERLAASRNLWIKMSGLPAYCGKAVADLDDMKPYVDAVADIFGADRMVWGGDWPVVNLGGGLPHWCSLTRQLLLSASEDERAAIGYRNVRKLYKGSKAAENSMQRIWSQI